ncbi:hypothetical protein SAMN05444266_107184 [Chitinophaga jiangningensis]|uniref:Uncharacterized protein n=1 Tax=Chitinophaga jiangningensis TaxID=1419482 RepID=A0A1M7HD22_9BACT|nr:hypothetical protein [Chitinophaga jiangningensis]SHM26336.1 hypothetical protein SAMN05444266_107184 [Chitinophaga jiangningensis]
MSLDQNESSIFSEKEFETAVKGKAYPTVGQLFVLIPVAIGACILAAIPFMLYVAKNPSEQRNTYNFMGIGTGVILGVLVLLAIFMFWQKKKHEPDYKFTFHKPIQTDFLGKATLTFLISNVALYLVAEKLKLDALSYSMGMYAKQLGDLGTGVMFICNGLVLPIISGTIQYDIIYDGLLKNYKTGNVMIAVIIMALLNLKLGLILVSLPTVILGFLIYNRTRTILYLLVSIILMPVLMMGILMVMPLDDFLTALNAIPVWATLLALLIAGLCWFVLLKDLQKMEPASGDAV